MSLRDTIGKYLSAKRRIETIRAGLLSSVSEPDAIPDLKKYSKDHECTSVGSVTMCADLLSDAIPLFNNASKAGIHGGNPGEVIASIAVAGSSTGFGGSYQIGSVNSALGGFIIMADNYYKANAVKKAISKTEFEGLSGGFVGVMGSLVGSGHTSGAGNGESRTDINCAILKWTKKRGLPPGLVKAIIRMESNFDPDAESSSGARGLMQLLPSACSDAGYNYSDMFDIDTNIAAGTKYFSMLIGDGYLGHEWVKDDPFVKWYNGLSTEDKYYVGLAAYSRGAKYIHDCGIDKNKWGYGKTYADKVWGYYKEYRGTVRCRKKE